MPCSSSHFLGEPARRPRQGGRFVLPLVALVVAVAASLTSAVDLDVKNLAVNDSSGVDLVLPAADGSVASEASITDDGGPIQQVAAVADTCREAAEDCREALKALRDDKLGDIELDIRVSGTPGNDFPCECRLEGEEFRPRKFACTTFTWKAAGYCHKPLYFEHWTLERYGHSHGWADPIISGAHFFATLPVLPYKMGVELPWECVYPLGYYRPGSCAPWTVPAVPISKRGLALEAATVTGLVFLLP
ncbi:MAG: hypothetical protein ACKOB1_11525 [Planctomycetia bacterium]